MYIKNRRNISKINDGLIKRYSESFKLKVLAELSTGKYAKNELAKIYGTHSSTINEWIKKYDRKDLMQTRILVENIVQKELKQLKEVLIKKDLEALALDSYLHVAAENLGYKSVEELKKNLNIKP
jgi:transposase-like protein